MFKIKELSKLILRPSLKFKIPQLLQSNQIQSCPIIYSPTRYLSYNHYSDDKISKDERGRKEQKSGSGFLKINTPKDNIKYQSHDGTQDLAKKTHSQQANTIDQAYIQKFGKIKTQILDSWLEMSNNQLIQECSSLQIIHSEKHIENMQKLFDYLKSFEKSITPNSAPYLKTIAPIDKDQYNDDQEQSRYKQKLFSQRSSFGINVQKQTQQSSSQSTNQSTNNQRRLSPEAVENAKLEFQSDLDRIFKNKRKQRSLFQTDKSKSFADEQEQQNTTQYSIADNEVQEEVHQYVKYQVPRILKPQEFFFNNDFLKKAHENRGQMWDTQYSQNALHSSNQNQFDYKFTSYIEIKDKLLREMSLKEEDLYEMSNLVKKKIMINMQFISEVNNKNPNIQYSEQLKQEELIPFIANNWETLTQINQQSFIQRFQGNKQFQEISSTTLKQNVDYPCSLIAFQKGIKKLITKKCIRQMLMDDKLSILRVLPSHENFNSINKSLHYNILSDVLTNESPDNIRMLDKVDLFMIIEKVMEMQESQKCRDIFNKLKGQMLFMNQAMLTIEDYVKIFDMLATTQDTSKEVGVEQDTTRQLDIKLFSLLLTRKSIKTLSHIPYNNSNLDVYVDLYQKIYKQIPFYFAQMTLEGKYMLFRFIELSQQMLVPFNTLVKLANIIIPSLYQPTLFFSELTERTDQSYRNPKDVDPEIVKNLVNEITNRMDEGEHTFEHLQLSQSRIHKNYVPFNEDSILLVQRILSDLVGANNPLKETLGIGQIGIINKIFSNELLALKLFPTQKEAIKIINNSVDQQLQLDQNLINLFSHKDKVEYFIDLFKSLDNFQTLLSSSNNNEEIQKKCQAFLEMSMLSLQQDLIEVQSYKLEDYIKINQSLQNALRHFKDLKAKYQLNFPLYELVQVMLESYYLQKKPIIQNFKKLKKNVKVQKIITDEITKTLIQNNIGSLMQHLLQTTSDNNKQISLIMLLTLENSRKLLRNDLANLFQLSDKYSISDQIRALIIKITPNLITIDQRKFYADNEDESPFSFNQVDNQVQKDPAFEQTQQHREKEDQQLKTVIIHKYLNIWHHESQLFAPKILSNNLTNKQNKDIQRSRQEIGLGPLSKLMADVLDDFSDQQVLTCLQILGSENVDNYHGDFIKKLYQRFSNQTYIESLFKNNHKLFFEIARYWPHFLKNNAILAQLMQIKQTKVLVAEQSETLSILAHKNVLHPDLIETHFETFIKMRDKESVGKYIKDLLHSCAFLGYAQIDVTKLTLVFRRIHKDPSLIEDEKLILDYLIVLSLSDVYYKDLDEKSVKFVEDCIEIIEKKFTGIQTIQAIIKDQITNEEEMIKLNYFNPIETYNKIYNKAIIKSNKEPKAESSVKNGKYQTNKSQNNLQAKEQSKSQEQDESEGLGEEPYEEDLQLDSNKQWQLQKQKQKLMKQIKLDQLEDITIKIKEEDESVIDVKKLKNDSSIEDILEEEDDDEDSLGPSNERKIYERKASESQYSEELEFHQFRKKKIAALDRKAKHLLLFSNINQLNFVDINKSDYAKAWVVLFHFKSKTFDSIIYDEFESIAMRNTIGKSKGHELFIKFYMKLLEVGYKRGCKVQIASKCDKTGWPVDITLINNEFIQKRVALYFLLQEELCINAKTNQEEPLGLQKLMLKHLTHISNHKVEFVTENGVYAKKDKLNEYIDELFVDKLIKSLELKQDLDQM